ncbi:putative Transmembrane protein [Quillaja saponaria]|uniref:Transmembrane protein n=1 Tax=Quillaja saponaria TaxID=32244 RepID=A0AAD7Q1I3_QUISA|nr:putative Transmembrane protein [Quillaja saponaria]
MGWHNCQQKARESFYIFTLSLLSLLLPLSFLLIARLSGAQYYLLTFTSYSAPESFSFLFSLFLHTNPCILYVLVFIVSIGTLIQSLTGKITLLNESPSPVVQPRLYTAWIVLCTLQVCVGLGIEGSIAAGIDVSDSSFGVELSLLSRVIFLLGLHEATLHWFRTVVKPVVEDTVFGYAREERWAEKVVMAASLGALWWWKLRNEIQILVVMAEVKKEQLMGVAVADFVCWGLYYLIVTIGMVRIVKGLMWIGMISFCRREIENSSKTWANDDKVHHTGE